MAKYQVITDLCSGVHASAWHNRRFYFNPVTQKLEQILYDLMPFGYGEEPPFIYESIFKYPGLPVEETLDLALIQNEEYRKLYFEHFNRIISEEYLNNIFTEYQTEIDNFESAIQIEEPSFVFAKERFYANVSYLRSKVVDFEALWVSKLESLKEDDVWVLKDDYSPRSDKGFFEDIALNAYLQDSGSLGYTLALENYHLNEIEVCGYESKKWPGHVYEIEDKIVLEGFNSENHSAEYIALYKPKKLFYKVSNQQRRYYSCSIAPWAKPEGGTTRMKLSKSTSWTKYCKAKNSNEVVMSGDVSIDELIYFPKGISLTIMAGTKINFKGSGGLIVNGDLFAKGTIGQPIEINGEGDNCQGITVLNSDVVVLRNIIATGLSNLKHEHWELTGAITVYESNVTIENVEIIDADCEDALNLIRSDFDIDALTIVGCKSDGFDADYCNGYLRSSVFRNTGNDCIDFSGSRVTLNEIYIQNSGDKGVSGGENSILSMENITIDGAITGIASKDKSQLYGEHVSIKNAEYSLMVFQKKPEYGPAQLKLENSQVMAGQEVIDLNSVLTLNGQVKKGTEKLNVDALYVRFK